MHYLFTDKYAKKLNVRHYVSNLKIRNKNEFGIFMTKKTVKFVIFDIF
jgi:hypothetical protein